jgi:hypothetical protein
MERSKESDVLLCCILVVITGIIIYYFLKWCRVHEFFDNKREMRKRVYGKYETDPDDDMNDDNLLLRYLDK